MRGRSRQHTEVAVAVDARWRHEGGEAVEQLERAADQRATGAGAWFGVVVQEALGIELAWPFQGERWPGAIPQQTLAPGAVLGLNAQRAVHRNEVSVEANAGFIGVKRSGRN